MEKIQVLVVDDHAIMRDGIRALLGPYSDIELVGEASGGKEAIEKAHQLESDVIVMDIAMPDMNGLEATQRIIAKNRKSKVLMLTQYENKEYMLSAIKARAIGYVPKRALSSELIAAIRAVSRGEPFLYSSVAKALLEAHLSQAKKPRAHLTTRENEILKLSAEGHTSREIAQMLSISLKTVHAHRAKLMKKLDLHNRTALIKYAMRTGLISVEP